MLFKVGVKREGEHVTSESDNWSRPLLGSTGGEFLLSINAHADDTTLMAESKEEVKSLLRRVKEESEKAGLKFSIQKLRSWHLAPSLHGKWMRKKWKE